MFCIDANIMVKVTVPEPLSDLAQALIEDAYNEGITIIAPYLFEAEVASAYRQKVKDRKLTEEQAQAAFAMFRSVPVQIQLIHSPTLVDRAFTIATEYKWRYVYDAFYVALAEQQSCDLWTADEVLVDDVSGDFPFVKWLGNYIPKTSSP